MDVQADEVDEGTPRREVLGALCLAVSAAVMLRGYALAGALGQAADVPMAGTSTWELVELGAGGSSLFPLQIEGVSTLATLVLAYVLVAEIGPRSRIGTVGRRVLEAAVAVAGLLAVGGVITTVAALRHPGITELLAAPGTVDGEPDAGALVTILDRGGSALPAAVGAALAFYVAWRAAEAAGLMGDEPAEADDLEV